MKKFLIALVAATTIGVTALATSSTADARYGYGWGRGGWGRGGWGYGGRGFGGFAAGAVIGGALAAPSYYTFGPLSDSYSYAPGYGSAYGYGPVYYAPVYYGYAPGYYVGGCGC